MPLTDVDDPTFLSRAIAVAPGLDFSGPLDSDRQIIRQLHEGHVLILLGKFEQLLPGGAELVSSLKYKS